MLTVGDPIPSPQEIIEARDQAGMTQAQAAALVHAKAESWRAWEAGRYKMPAGLFELFCIKAGVPNPFYPDFGDPGGSPGDQ